MQFVASEPVARGSGFYGSIRYYVPVREDGSGIDPYSAAATMNGEPLVCEWDGIGNRLVLPIPAALPRGAARLHVELSDRTGNRSAGDFSFMLE
jgi:hypothetical protein